MSDSFRSQSDGVIHGVFVVVVVVVVVVVNFAVKYQAGTRTSIN